MEVERQKVGEGTLASEANGPWPGTSGPLSGNHQPRITLRDWLPTLELALAAVAGGLWYLQGGWVWYAGAWPGPWPLVLLGVMVALTVSRAGLRAFRLTQFTVPLLAFLATAGVAYWAAYDPEVALAKAWLLIGAVGLYWALAHQPDARSLTVALGFWALFCVGLTAYFFVTNDWTDHPMKVPVLTRIGATIAARLPSLAAHPIHPNVAGGLLAMTLPFCVPLIALPRKDPDRLLHTALRVLGVAGLVAGVFGWVITVSRGAWVALVATGALWGLWRLLGRLGSRRRLAVMVTLGVTGAILTATVAWLVLGGRLAGDGTMGRYAGAAQSLVENRLRLLRLGALLARDTPFTGIGLGMFEMPFSVYTLLIHVGYIEHSHNLLLDLAIEQGVPGAMAFVVLAATAYVAGGWKLNSGYWKRRSSGLTHESGSSSPHPAAASDARPSTFDFQLIVESALASLTVLLIHGLVDDALYGSRGVLLLLVPFGVLAANSRLSAAGRRSRVRSHTSRGERHGSRSQRRVRTLCCVQLVLMPLLTALAIGCILGVGGDSGSTLATRWLGAWHANLGATAQARAELTIYDQHHFDDPTIDQVRRQEDLSAAVTHFERAVALDPVNPTARQRQTEIALARGAYDAGLHEMQALWDAGDRTRVTRLLYGDALVAAGRVDEAVGVVQGLEFAKARLLGQAWARYHLSGDAPREAYAREAATRVEE